MEQIEKALKQLIELAVLYTPKLLLAVITLFVGFWIIRLITRGVRRALHLGELEPTIQRFLTSLVDVILRIMLLLSVASMLGIETTSFLAILTSASLAVGLALQGGLSNFAGGVLILIFKPFKVGDIISAQGQTGGVQEISIFVTKILTPQNETIIIPNGALANGIIKNTSDKKSLRKELKITILDHTPLSQVRSTLLAAVANVEGVLPTPAPELVVTGIGDNTVSLLVMVHVLPDTHADTVARCYERLLEAILQHKISRPAPVITVYQGV